MVVMFCLFAFKIMDSLDCASSMAKDILIACRVELSVNVDLWVLEGGEVVLPTHITDTLCPEDCSGHGTCSAGELSSRHL